MIRTLLLAVLCAATPLCAATLTVTNLNDTGAGSLRQACTDAATGDSVVFQAGLAGVITFTAGQIDLGAKALTITGNADVSGAAAITLDGNNATRLLNTGAALSVNTLIMHGGYAIPTGGAIYSLAGGVTCTGCTFSLNESGSGGAIYSQGGVTCTDCTFSNNRSGGGGAITSAGAVTCSACTFEYNLAGGTASTGVGGAIVAVADVTCTDCTFFANSIYSGGGSGGAIYQSGPGYSVNCTNCAFYFNNTLYGGNGGAIYCQCDGIACTGCTFSGNHALGAGGAINAGVYAVTCTDCTFSANVANPNGGRCLYTGAQVTITNCVVADQYTGSMFAGGGAFTSGGYNICTAALADVPWLNATGDQPGTDPMLGPVQDNGGPVQTMRPLIGSPAIDQGGGSTTTVDARGFARPFDNPAIANATGGDGRDIGAVEFVFNSAPAITSPPTQIVARDTAFTFSGTISVADDASATEELQLTLTVTQGTLTLAQITGLTFNVGDGTADASMEFTGTLADINAALNGMTFTPTPAYLGAASMQIDVDDQGNAGDGPVLTDSASIAITVVEQPEITLLREGVVISSGGGDNAWGPAGTAIVRTYAIRNDGITALNVGGVTFANESNCTATLTTPPAATVAPGATSDFTITITPVATGSFSFDFAIASDDADENPYNVQVVGTTPSQSAGGDSDDDDGCSTGTSRGYPAMCALALLALVAALRRVAGRGSR